jgi:hypothetical protein
MKGNKSVDMELKEISRTYFFPNGNTITVVDAVKCLMNKINTHQLITKQGEVYIVPYKWLAMKYKPTVKDIKSKNEISKK